MRYNLPPKKKRFGKLRGHWWMIRKFGLGTWFRYEQDRKAGMTIDYSRVFTKEERAVLEEHGLAMWGSRTRS